jgi:argininosuccinate lyase
MTDTMKNKANKMWGGHFDKPPAEIMEEINASIDFDKILYLEDITGSKAHCKMLAEQKIISDEECKDILKGLDTVLSEIENGTFEFKKSLEDIHMNVEARLSELIGDTAGKLHTARSRNDQVATDFKLWVKARAKELSEELKILQKAFIKKAEENLETIMPGFTHLQTAQPVTFAYNRMAYVEMFERDRTRIADLVKRMDECPLGSAALAGTSYPIDRFRTAQKLGFSAPSFNGMDSVSDRDFAIEFLSLASICSVHLSRFAEEIVVWMSKGFNFIKLSDEFTSGSSIMPQKRNPDAAELVRAKTGRIYGS